MSKGSLIVDGGGNLTAESVFIGNAALGGGTLRVSGTGSAATVAQALKVSPLNAFGRLEVLDNAKLTVGSALIGTVFFRPLVEFQRNRP